MLLGLNSKLEPIKGEHVTLEDVYNYIAENDICDYITISDELHDYGKFSTVGIEDFNRLEELNIMNREIDEVYEMFDDNTIELTIAEV